MPLSVFRARKPINHNIFSSGPDNANLQSEVGKKNFFKKKFPPFPPKATYFREFGVEGTFFPAGNYFPNPWQILKKRTKKGLHDPNQITANVLSFQYQLLRRSRSDSHCFVVAWRKKPCGLPRISYFSKDLIADKQIKQPDAEVFFSFLFFSLQNYFHLVPRPKLQISQICRFSKVVLHDLSLISEILSHQAGRAPSSTKSVSHWVTILFSHWVCLCCSGHISGRIGETP